MKENALTTIKDGAQCKVISGVHVGKTGTIRDIKTGKSGHISITDSEPHRVGEWIELDKFKQLSRYPTLKPIDN